MLINLSHKDLSLLQLVLLPKIAMLPDRERTEWIILLEKIKQRQAWSKEHSKKDSLCA